MVATVLTVYGIETGFLFCNSWFICLAMLQQYLPFTVLKQLNTLAFRDDFANRCNSTYRLRY